MTFLDDEALQQSSSPVELFRFIGPTKVYRYTSLESNITVFGDEYVAVPSLRSSIVSPGEGSPPALSLTLPVDVDVAKDFAFAIPVKGLNLTVFRYHEATGNLATYWAGPVLNANVQKEVIVLRIPSEFGSRIKSKLPRILFQTLCNNILFDGICSVIGPNFREQTQIASLSSPTEKTVTVDSMGPRPDGWATGGYIQHVVTGQKRMLIFQTGTTMTMLYPFQGAEVGDAVEVYAGCDHTLATCNEKFSNKDNFNGFRYLPTKGLGQQA